MAGPKLNDPVLTEAIYEKLVPADVREPASVRKPEKASEVIGDLASMVAIEGSGQAEHALRSMLRNPEYKAAGKIAIESEQRFIEKENQHPQQGSNSIYNEEPSSSEMIGDSYKAIASIREAMADAGIVQTHHDTPNFSGVKPAPSPGKRTPD